MKNPLRVDEMINPHVSVDCVVLGFDGEHLKVLLVKQTGHEENGYYNNMKLPGSLIYNDEGRNGMSIEYFQKFDI